MSSSFRETIGTTKTAELEPRAAVERIHSASENQRRSYAAVPRIATLKSDFELVRRSQSTASEGTRSPRNHARPAEPRGGGPATFLLARACTRGKSVQMELPQLARGLRAVIRTGTDEKNPDGPGRLVQQRALSSLRSYPLARSLSSAIRMRSSPSSPTGTQRHRIHTKKPKTR